MAYNDKDALFIDPREPRPAPPTPTPESLQVLPNANPGATTCSVCNRAVNVADLDGVGRCSICADGATPIPTRSPVDDEDGA